MEKVKSGQKAKSKRDASYLLKDDKISNVAMSAEISFTNPAYIVILSERSPNEAAAHCKMAISSLHSGFNRRKYELLGAIVRIAYDLTAVHGEWSVFCRNPFWNQFKRKPKNSARGLKQALRLVMRFAFDAKTKNEINVTNRYAKMLELEYNTGVSPDKIADIIEKFGGIEKMRKVRVKVRLKEKLERQRKKDEQADKKFRDDLMGNNDNDDTPEKKFEINKNQYSRFMKSLDIFYVASRKYFKSSIR